MKQILSNPLLNKSEIARKIGLSPAMFTQKLNNVNYNKFSDAEIEKITQILIELAEELQSINNNK